MKVIDKVSNEDALWAADRFIEYFQNFGSIEDYLRYAKKEVIGKVNNLSAILTKFWP